MKAITPILFAVFVARKFKLIVKIPTDQFYKRYLPSQHLTESLKLYNLHLLQNKDDLRVLKLIYIQRVKY